MKRVLGYALISIDRFQVLFKEFQCNFSYLWIFEITMPFTDDCIKRDGDAMRNQGIIQDDTLLVGHQRVTVAMHDQKRRRIPGHISDWVRSSYAIFMRLNGSANQF